MRLLEELRRKGVRHLNVGWAKFTLLSMPYIEVDGHELDGVTDFSEYSITLSEKLNIDASKRTLLHEIWHCILAGMWMEDRGPEYGDAAGMVHISNEDLAENITRGTMLFRSLNPQLWEVLLNPRPQ
tara:strand:- start:2859 stop:3239 length:381 start_codon:yes stop_codon:yes gene_type:complete